jgi:hypothetical protein
MAEVLHSLSIVLMILSGVFLITALVLWRVFKIPKVIGDLSGRNARKSVAHMRVENEKKGKKTPESVSVKLGKNAETGLLNENVANGYENNATELLIDDEGFGIDGVSVATAPLTGEISKQDKILPNIRIKLIEEEMIIHTKEVI